MLNKFVVLWLQTVFITNDSSAGNGKELEDNELVLQADHLPSLEEAIKFYNAKAADDTVQQVMILVPLKDFKRSVK